MKKLYLIGGPMGIGKTTVAKVLAEKLPKSVYFDGDWAWDLHPFIVNTENIQMVHENIAFVLNQFLGNSQIENVIFTWVMHEQAIIDKVLSDLTEHDFKLCNISLMADEATLTRNFVNDPKRDESRIPEALIYLKKYETLNTLKIDRTGKMPEETAEEIIKRFV